MKLLLLFCLALLHIEAAAADLSGLRPGRVTRQAAMSVTASDGTVAVATEDGELWVGTRRLRQIAQLDEVPDGLHLGRGALSAWATTRTGLCVETERWTWTLDGKMASRGSTGAAPLAATSMPGWHALLWPGHLELISLTDGQPRRIPIPGATRPGGAPDGLGFSQGLLVVQGGGETLLQISPKTACPQELKDIDGAPPLLRWRIRQARRVCETPLQLPDAVDAAAEMERRARRLVAIRDGDTDALARLGAPSCDEIQARRPKARSTESTFQTRHDARVGLAKRLRASGGQIAVLQAPDLHMQLGPWTRGAQAPACHATLILAPGDDAAATWFKRLVAEHMATGATCAGSVKVAAPGELTVTGDDRQAAILYLDSQTRIRGNREGAVSASMARMDLARLDASDPLHPIAEAPELVPSWSVGPGPGGPIILDVDDSWVAATGWDLVRGPAKAIRTERVSLPGAVQRLQGRQDGRFEVVVGGQPARVAFEDREVVWGGAPAPKDELLPVPDPLPPRPQVDPGPWRIVGDGVIAAGSTRLDLKLPIRRLVNGGNHSVVVTPIGLLGVDKKGQYAWRLTEVDRWVWTGDFVVGTNPMGVHGHRLPR